MAPRARSAGVLLYRCHGGNSQTLGSGDTDGALEVLIGHMGGPLWAHREAAAWSIPKGLVDSDDIDDRAAACREFREETGHDLADATLTDLGVFEQSRAKEIHIWAAPGDLDAAQCASNTFELEWPPRTGQLQRFPEIDRFDWVSIERARSLLIVGQRQVLDALVLAACPDTS